jgi:hypothetical protein
MADLVVADISIHNANVFYELGIRHALRDRATVLIRARIDEVPFDLKRERYLSYHQTAAGADVPRLVQMLRVEVWGQRQVGEPTRRQSGAPVPAQSDSGLLGPKAWVVGKTSADVLSCFVERHLLLPF